MGILLQCFNVNSQAETLWKKLVRSCWCSVLWVPQTEWNHYWGSLSNTIEKNETNTQRKTHHDKIIRVYDSARAHFVRPIFTRPSSLVYIFIWKNQKFVRQIFAVEMFIFHKHCYYLEFYCSMRMYKIFKIAQFLKHF